MARVAIAIDYHENGYRTLMYGGINDPCLLHAMLAVASSHHSKWRQNSKGEPRAHLRKAIVSLQERLKSQNLVYEETTITAMLTLLSFEVQKMTPLMIRADQIR